MLTTEKLVEDWKTFSECKPPH